MQPPTPYPCPNCGATFQLTPEYLAQYGGQATVCTRCGRPFALPLASGGAPASQIAQRHPALQPGWGQPPAGGASPVIPYAAPLYGQTGSAEAAWRQGDLLVVRKGARLPHAIAPYSGRGRAEQVRQAEREGSAVAADTQARPQARGAETGSLKRPGLASWGVTFDRAPSGRRGRTCRSTSRCRGCRRRWSRPFA